MVTLRIRSSFSPRAEAVVFLAAPKTKRADARMSATRRGTIGKPSASIIPAGVRSHLESRGANPGTVTGFPANSARNPVAVPGLRRTGWYNISLPPIPGVIPKMDEKERSRALEIALSQIEKQFGKGSILLDAALGVGGLPRGRVNEIFGPESSGKTTIALQVVAEAQKAGGIAAFIDVEHALDPAYARKLGVDVDNLLVSQPDYGEQALEITAHLIASGQIDVLVVDSVAALVPKSELDGEMGDSHMGLQARLMSQALRKLTGSVSKSNTCLIFINQIREKIGVMFGNPETTTGGRALKFYASTRLDIRRIAAIKDGDAVVGNRTKVKVVKNKVASPFREAEFDIIYGEGVSKEGDLLDQGVAQNIIEKSGSWFSYKSDRIGQGRENARQFLKDNPDIRRTVDTEVRKALGLIKPDGAPVAAPVEVPPTAKPAPARR